MDSKKFHFWQKIFTYANVLTVLVGFLLALFPDFFLIKMWNDGTREAFFNGAEFSPDVLALKNWLSGIIGATIISYALLMVFISENALKNKERWAYVSAWSALLVWFILDSAISWYYGAIHNIVMINLVSLVMTALPLIMMRAAFKKIDGVSL